jgi:hypothetical protein
VRLGEKLPDHVPITCCDPSVPLPEAGECAFVPLVPGATPYFVQTTVELAPLNTVKIKSGGWFWLPSGKIS